MLVSRISDQYYSPLQWMGASGKMHLMQGPINKHAFILVSSHEKYCSPLQFMGAIGKMYLMQGPIHKHAFISFLCHACILYIG